MEQVIKEWLANNLRKVNKLTVASDTIEVRTPKDKKHGDYTSNIALIIAPKTEYSPDQLAQELINVVPLPAEFSRVEVAAPGFINIYLKADTRVDVIRNILQDKEHYGCQPQGSKGRVLVEFVSANPTGPLHIGHGRGAAYGAAIVNLLTAAGYQADSEYYVNDRGRQMDVLTLSVWLRYLELCGQSVAFPQGAYQGDYVWDIAAQLHKQNEQKFAEVLPQTETSPIDQDQYLDSLIKQMKLILGDQLDCVFNVALTIILDRIRKDLEKLGVSYDKWLSERAVVTDQAINETIKLLGEKEALYQKEGACWFKSSQFGDEKDRVLIRANGQPTYFACDIAYHINKYQRGYDVMINVWGADHHGYIARIKGALKAAGFDEKKLHIILVQFVNLLRNGELTPMSTRSGEFQPLETLQKEVGSDAVRIFYLMCRYSQHVDFDVELAKSQTKESPVYYIQYAHARVCSLFTKMEEKGYQFTLQQDSLTLLSDSEEVELLKLLAQYKTVLNSSVKEFEPHILLSYTRKLVGSFHSYYNSHQILIDDDKLRNARLSLVRAVGQIINNSLRLLGISAPHNM